MKQLIALVDDWDEAVHKLANRSHNFQQNELIQRDVKAAPKVTADLNQRLAKTENPLWLINPLFSAVTYQQEWPLYLLC